MASYFNYYLKINKLIDTLDNVEDVAGAILVKNIKKEAEKKLKGGKGKYPYDYNASFQRDDVTFYEAKETTVHVRHPAANRLEYGQDIDLTIKPKKGQALLFTGKNGEPVYREEVFIPKGSFKPVCYARAAIKDTQRDLKKKFDSIITETNA